MFSWKGKCLEVWPAPVPPTVIEEPIEDVLPLVTIHMQWPAQTTETVSVTCAPGTTGKELFAAESKLGSLDFEHTVTLDGMPMDFSVSLEDGALIAVLPVGWSVRAEPSVVSCCLEGEEEVEPPPVTEVGVKYDVPVTTLGQLEQLRLMDQTSDQRVSVLHQQGPVWSDDELLFWLQTTAAAADSAQHVQVWDPLLVSGLSVCPVESTWHALTSQLGEEATVVSAVAVDRHWYPLVWRFDAVGSKLFTCGVPEQHEGVFATLAATVNAARKIPGGEWNAKDLGFVVTKNCGAVVVAFVRHLLVEARLPQSMHEVDLLATELRVGFERCLSPMCLRPRLAGLGLVDQVALQELLKSHGVTTDELKVRAQALVSALGDSEIARALQCSNPWKELKWLANQQRPPLQIIKPSELQFQVQKRQGQGTVGHKKHKVPKGKGKSKQVEPSQSLDPTRLRLEHGLLQSDSGQPLSQITLPQVASMVSGVVLTTMALAGPYLQSGKVLSTGALAFFVVDSVQPIQGLPSGVVRLPLVCAENSEPLLVDGLLIQLGTQQVQRPLAGVGCEVASVATCVIKAMVFRDLVSVPWSHVVAHPMQYVIQHLGPLQVCDDEECAGCEAWHKSDQYPLENPLIEVWGRQWMTHSFEYCNPDDADMFAVHVRLPETLQNSIQEFSGDAGVFVEPKSVCGRKPSSVFQVIWTPRSDLRQLIMQRQTLPEVCGVARLGNKLGLRCRVEFAASLSAKIRPEQVFLPQGDKLTFLVGPMPYGTLKSSLTKAMSEYGWTVRPLQPVSTRSTVPGLMFRVQAITEPPRKVMRMSHGDVVVTRETEMAQPGPEKPGVIATPATVSKVSTEMPVDELQLNDPWAKGPSKGVKPPAPVHIGSPLDDIESRVISAVMAQLPKAAMEVDAGDETADRVGKLEQQVHELHQHTQTLQQTVVKQAADQDIQFSEIRNQVVQQGAHFEAAIATHSVQLHSFQESFQEQFRQQSAQQQHMLDSMFQQQMNQFESLLSKRHRPE